VGEAVTRKKDKPIGYAHPQKLSEHAITRWHQRHRNAWSRDLATANLRQLLPEAKLVEIDAANLQAIWKLPVEDGVAPLLVVDAQGLVRTVLPRHATAPEQRRFGHPRPVSRN
jgi:hypothetical protein